MIPLPELSADELAALEQDMRLGPYLMRPRVRMLDLDHQVLDDLSDRVLDGQVDCKLEGTKRYGTTTRSCQLSLSDPRRQVAVDGNSAAAGAIFYDKLIEASVRFRGPRIGRWVTIPVFCGPITNGVRAGHAVNITASGKERLAMGMLWQTRIYRKASSKNTAVRDLLERAGEAPSRIKLPGNDSRLPQDLVLTQTDPAWPNVRELVGSSGRQGMYDGRGDFRVRAWPQDVQVLFRDGEGGNILTDPEVTYDAYDGFNGVRVVGPAHGKKQITFTAWLPPGHPLSPKARIRGGVPFRRALVIDVPHLRTEREAEAYAGYYLNRMAREIVHITVDVMPNWLLEPGDVAAFTSTSLGRVEQVLTEFSVPLMPGAAMTLGANKAIRRPRPKLPTRLPTPAPQPGMNTIRARRSV